MHSKHTELQEAVITGAGAYVPPRRMSNDELAGFLDTSDEWIFSKTGIHNRHIAAEDQATSDLGAAAARQALADAGLTPLDIDLILVATSSPDYNGLPSTACVVQDLLGATNAAAMDVAAVCSGFVYALETARAFARSGSARRILVIGAEIYSRVVDWSDRSTCVLFGDGAGAVVVESLPESAGNTAPRFPRARVLDSVLKSRGSDAQALVRPAGGTRRPVNPGDNFGADQFLQMDGRKVYNFAVGAIGEVIQELLTRNGLSLAELDWVIPHQANARILEAAARRLKYPVEQMYSNIAEYANTSAASIPIAMNEMAAAGMLKPGQNIITVGFGAGLTYGGNLLRTVV
ncbi:beta-ketoacyl-ACP synthase III [Spirochaeta africana]|uniref:Beta-ketoacyl-[acyl-carrier-protein] synthase III n=1 Tax=Spirochaeta africana (strain ATCC 700263 / DSM 8902 / Z-7692) TaxID=889378 RepID=H9UFR1_SPIAZ|nr:beta-ketoacyl-ACP synthase III [Spirochaeta africana]AFG36354.1 3-oxoacyl-(acyl-carrier-protein) synthase III [Spirochaeta africana DSM 8902]